MCQGISEGHRGHLRGQDQRGRQKEMVTHRRSDGLKTLDGVKGREVRSIHRSGVRVEIKGITTIWK